MLRKLGMILLYVLSFILLVVILGVIWVYTAPQFGETPDKISRKTFTEFEYFDGEKFKNAVETNMDIHAKDFPSMMYQFYFVKGDKEPSKLLPQLKIQSSDLKIHNDSNLYLRWFGHSAIYVELDGKRLLLDPMLGPVAAPHKLLGPNRFNKELPIAVKDLPEIDAVIFSHDHYDHLDHPTILKIKDKVGHFYVPLGLGSHLKSWGVPENKITELKWWDEVEYEGLKFVCTPARHFSGRGLTNRNTTLWASWVIQGDHHNIYFSGDGGYWDGYKDIGDKYGPFDLCMMECGAYNKLWHSIHMMPEETAQATVDLQGRLLMPIHWGAFNLALHSWTDPIVRVNKKADELGVEMLTPIIGEEVIIPKYVPNEEWWTGD